MTHDLLYSELFYCLSRGSSYFFHFLRGKTFVKLMNDVRFFPKRGFLERIFPKSIFRRGNLPSLSYPQRSDSRCSSHIAWHLYPILAEALARHHSSLRRLRMLYLTLGDLGKLPLGKLHHLRSCHLGRRL